MIELRATITGENPTLVVLEGVQIGFDRDSNWGLCHCRHQGLLIVGCNPYDLLDSSSGETNFASATK
jgi:hypothetical protein